MKIEETFTINVQPGVNFTNILHTAFTCADLKSAKKTDDLTVFFALLGSVCLKAVCLGTQIPKVQKISGGKTLAKI